MAFGSKEVIIKNNLFLEKMSALCLPGINVFPDKISFMENKMKEKILSCSSLADLKAGIVYSPCFPYINFLSPRLEQTSRFIILSQIVVSKKSGCREGI